MPALSLDFSLYIYHFYLGLSLNVEYNNYYNYVHNIMFRYADQEGFRCLPNADLQLQTCGEREHKRVKWMSSSSS